MADTTDNALVLFPGALGDFLCCLPTLIALRQRHRGVMRIVARASLLELLRLADTVTTSIDRHEIADLFAQDLPLRRETCALFDGAAVVYSWTGFGNPAFVGRLARASGGDVSVFPFRGMQLGEHAIDYYARCAGVTPHLDVAAALRDDFDGLAAVVPEIERREPVPALVMHPGSGSPTKNWQGFAALADRWRRGSDSRLVVLCGPAEAEVGCSTDSHVRAVRGLSLPQVTALLRRCHLYVGNDSGISHLAGAVGAYGVVLFGPSDPATWAPRGENLRVMHRSEPCASCGPEIFCTHRLPVDGVHEALISVQQ